MRCGPLHIVSLRLQCCSNRARHCRLQIEEAYDILLMESLKRRRTGEADVARSVRFADVPQPKKKQVRVAATARVIFDRTTSNKLSPF